jgi:hypothetical protein
MPVEASETWMAGTDRLRLRLLLAEDALALREVAGPGLVRVLEKIGMRLVDSYHDEDGQRDIYRPCGKLRP